MTGLPLIIIVRINLTIIIYVEIASGNQYGSRRNNTLAHHSIYEYLYL